MFPYPMWRLDADRFIYFANPAAEREIPKFSSESASPRRGRAVRRKAAAGKMIATKVPNVGTGQERAPRCARPIWDVRFR